jgi:hypothetical protein
MKLLLYAGATRFRVGEDVTIQVTVFNDSYQPITLDPGLLVGPNPIPERFTGMPLPISVEPTVDEPREIILNPFCFYGRERTWNNLQAGQVTVTAYLVARRGSAWTPSGPADENDLLLRAEPLVLTISDRGDE